MSRKYIKNCTGERCEGENVSSNIASTIVFYALLACFVGVSVYVLFFSQYLQIANISINGVKELNSQEVQQVVDDSLGGKYLGLIPKNNFLFISQEKTENLLMGNFKKIRTVKVIKKFPSEVNIDIDEREALLVWCASEKCYLLDENGVAYSAADFSSPEIVQNNLLQISETSGREVAIGTKVIEPSYEQYVLGIKGALSAVGFNATDQYFTPSRMAEEIKVKTDQESEIYFSTQYPLESALRTLATVLKKEIAEDKRGDLAYIDLRNENKVFYKFKNVEPSVAENSEVVSAEAKKAETK